MRHLVFALIFIFSFPALADLPKVREVKSSGGYTAWVIEDHYLPIVSLRLTFTRSGSAHDGQSTEGLAYLVSGLLDEGAGDLSSLAYRTKLEELATSISFNADEDYFYVSLKCLTRNLDESLKLLNLTLTQPTLAPEAIERIRNQILTRIEKSSEDPQYLASRALEEGLFGSHPYGWPSLGTEGSVKAVTRQDLQSFVAQHFTRGNVIISIAGDVTGDDVMKRIDRALLLPQQTQTIPPIPEVSFPAQGSRKDIAMPLPQSVILFGGEGILRNDPLFYPAYVLNHILGGGGFESRLMQEVREKNGLAYTVYTSLDTLRHGGTISGYAGTDSKKVEQSVALIRQEIERVYREGVTDQELRDAKDYLIGSHAIRLTKNENLTTFLSVMQTESLGMDFLEKRNSYIEAVTAEQIKQAAKKLLDINKMLFIVVGGEAK